MSDPAPSDARPPNADCHQFGWNPAHPVGTCGRCGGEMTHNVPRMGAAGGFVHRATGSLQCGVPDPIVVIVNGVPLDDPFIP